MLFLSVMLSDARAWGSEKPRILVQLGHSSPITAVIKIGARQVRHGRYAISQMAEVAIPRRVFATILTMINALRGPPRSGALA
jgi:hypothetical protein